MVTEILSVTIIKMNFVLLVDPILMGLFTVRWTQEKNINLLYIPIDFVFIP